MREKQLFNDEAYKEPRLINTGYAGGYRSELYMKPNGCKMERRYNSDGSLYSELHHDGHGYYAKKGTRFDRDEDGNLLDSHQQD